MSNDIVIIGGGGHAKVLINIIKKNNNFSIIGYLDFIDNGKILSVGYLGKDEIIEQLIKNGLKNITFGIGKINSSNTRENIIKNFINYNIKFPKIISNSAIINEDVEVGKGVQILDGVIINSGSFLSDFCIVNTHATLEHDCFIGKYTHIAPGVTISGGVKIGDSVLIGTGATIIQGIKICNNAIIGAGSVVVKDITEEGTYVGNPCRKLK